MVDFLEWDSSFFKMKIGRVFLKSKEEILLLNSFREYFDLIYVFVSPDVFQTHEVEDILSNCVFVDNKITFFKKVPPVLSEKRNDLIIKNATIAHYNSEFQNLAFESGKYSRFKIDENFGEDSFKNLYTEWIKKSLSKEIASEVFYIEINNVIAAMITVGKKEANLEIGLIAVNEEFQGRGLGSVLLYEVDRYAYFNQFNEIHVATQGKNIAACNFYSKNGFQKQQEINIYHLWKEV